MEIKCPECQSTNIIKSGVRKIALRNGSITELQMHRCKDCYYQFSDKKLAKSSPDYKPIVISKPDNNTNVALSLDVYKKIENSIKRKNKYGNTIPEWLNGYLTYQLFRKR